jgi:hypothetical protein
MESRIIGMGVPLSIETARIRERLRRVYSSNEGKEELLNYLIEMGTFSEITEDELPLRNMAVHKLQQLGFLDMETIVATIAFLTDRPAVTPGRLAERPEERY